MITPKEKALQYLATKKIPSRWTTTNPLVLSHSKEVENAIDITLQEQAKQIFDDWIDSAYVSKHALSRLETKWLGDE